MNEMQMQQAIARLSKKMGKGAISNLLSVLGRDREFMNAIESPVGQELMADAVGEIEEKMSLWLTEKETPSDRAELKAYLTIIKKWQAKIARYNENSARLQGALKEAS